MKFIDFKWFFDLISISFLLIISNSFRTSSLSDRIRIARNATFPEINLSPQVLLNCGNAGTCDGGWPLAAYDYIKKNGIPDETCQPYEAYDAKGCSPYNICRNCDFNVIIYLFLIIFSYFIDFFN